MSRHPNSSLGPETSLDPAQTPEAVLAGIIAKAKNAKDADGDLLAILEKHVLKVDAKDGAPQAAASDIEKLAISRAVSDKSKT
jgi:hypothetical protein